MTEPPGMSYLIWASVLSGLAVFFVLAARRLAGRGYEWLGYAVAIVATTELSVGIATFVGPGVVGFGFNRLATALGPLALGFNLQFILRYTGRSLLPKSIWVSHLSIALSALIVLISTWLQLPQVSSLSRGVEYTSPSFAFSVLHLLVLAGHFVAAIVVMWRGYQSRRPNTRGVLLALSLLAPATLVDVGSIFFFGQRWFVIEMGSWLYCLMVLASLLSEVHLAQGRLKETTSSLAERTAELEVSYAEIDLVYTELFQKQQLAAVGELAAAIAHEVRNPLAIIMNAVSGLRRKTITEVDKETLLSIVTEESNRLNHLVTELLRFARPVDAVRGPAFLVDICEQLRTHASVGEGVAVSVAQRDEQDSVLVDPGLLRLALDNLMANSAQAIHGKGTIELVIRKDQFQDGRAAAAVDVVDSGCGMKSQELENALKPFYTTKPRGTGLGIPIAARIVEAHGGELEIKSEITIGTTATIKLPLDKESPHIPPYSTSQYPNTRRRMHSSPFGANENDDTRSYEKS